MIRYLVLLLIVTVFSVSASSQDKFIIGTVVENETGNAMNYTSVYIDSLHGTATDENGYFILRLENLSSKDTLKIRCLSYFDLNFTNLPLETDTIYLGYVQLFEYSIGYEMVDFFCGRFNFKCKRKRRQHQKQEEERIDKYYFDRNIEIGKYEFLFNDQVFKINLENHCIDLTNRTQK